MPGIGGLASGELGGISGAGTGGGGGSGTVTSFSFTNANGFVGNVTNASTTPNLTVSVSIGTALAPVMVKANGTAIQAAVSGTDYSAGTSALATGLVVSTTGTGVLSTVAAPSGTVVGTSDTQTLTNKRITKRVSVVNAPGATPSINTDNFDEVRYTGLAANLTLTSTGTPQDGDSLIVVFTDNGTARTLLFTGFLATGTIALPTTTVASTPLYLGFLWNSTSSAWVIQGVS